MAGWVEPQQTDPSSDPAQTAHAHETRTYVNNGAHMLMTCDEREKEVAAEITILTLVTGSQDTSRVRLEFSGWSTLADGSRCLDTSLCP